MEKAGLELQIELVGNVMERGTTGLPLRCSAADNGALSLDNFLFAQLPRVKVRVSFR